MAGHRKILVHAAVTAALPVLIYGAVIESALAVEEAEYRLLSKADNIEVREYAPQIVAEVVVEDDFEAAGNRAFRPLFRYIDGNNRAQQEIAMTAPVSQEARSEKIAMTAPVSQSRADEGWVVSFMMPAEFSWDTIPEPLDPNVSLRQIPAHHAVVIRYSGTWSETGYRRHLEELVAWIDANGLDAIGEPVWARYNAPFVPWFMRRNEILLRVDGPPQSGP